MTGMRPEAYRMLAEREDDYWWHRARRSMSLGLLRRYGVRDGSRWLDLGCGTGGNLRLLDALNPSLVAGVDISPIALEVAQRKRPSALLVRADLNRPLPFEGASFDVVTAFNVLYHDWVDNDTAVIAQVARLLRPGGLFFLTEPAFSILSRELDVAVMTRRRYRGRDVLRMCRSANLEPRLITYFTSFGFPLLLGWKLISRLKRSQREGSGSPSPDMKPIHPLSNRILHGLAALESEAIIRGLRLPFGTTLVCVVQKPQKGNI
jgi:SAM-dependent methyltransferase